MRHIKLLSEINTLVKENKDNQATISLLRKQIPDYDWMLMVANRYGIDTTRIHESKNNHSLEINLIDRLEEEIKINKVEIKYLWKRMKSISDQR